MKRVRNVLCILKFLKYFIDIDDALVPNHSLIREFIGGSVFVCYIRPGWVRLYLFISKIGSLINR